MLPPALQGVFAFRRSTVGFVGNNDICGGQLVAEIVIEKVIKALYPFFGALLLVLLAVTYIPALSLWLPNLLLK